MCCSLASLLKAVCWIVQHLLLFTHDIASQRIKMHLHRPGLRIWRSPLLCDMPPATEREQTLSVFSQTDESPLCSVPQFALYDASIPHALGRVN